MAPAQLSAAARQSFVAGGRRQAAPRCGRQAAAVRCAAGADEGSSRRALLLGAASLAALTVPRDAAAIELGFKKDLSNKRRLQVPESEYSEGPEGLKFYDVVQGTGAEALPGKRIVVHYDCKWKGITIFTTRMGMGVTGGSPFGFDVGAQGAGGTLKGLDLGVRGMKVGGRRKLLVPPSLAYGDKGRGEIPPGAVLSFDVELLSVKQDARGFQVKLVEG